MLKFRKYIDLVKKGDINGFLKLLKIWQVIDSTSSAATSFLRRTHWLIVLLLLVVCIGSRILTSIYYVEDIDCLRFALSAHNYDITEMRPHFPGYAVYCFFLKGLFFITGHLAVSFSILGGIAIFLIVVFTLALTRLFAPTLKVWPLAFAAFYQSATVDNEQQLHA